MKTNEKNIWDYIIRKAEFVKECKTLDDKNLRFQIHGFKYLKYFFTKNCMFFLTLFFMLLPIGIFSIFIHFSFRIFYLIIPIHLISYSYIVKKEVSALEKDYRECLEFQEIAEEELMKRKGGNVSYTINPENSKTE